MNARRASVLLRIEAAILLVLMLLQLAACGESIAIGEPVRKQIKEAVAREYGYRTPLKFGAIWSAGAMEDSVTACGVFASPPEFGGNPARLRFIYDITRHYTQIEMHRLWVTDSAVSQAVMGIHRQAFDDLWTKWCAPFEPWQMLS